MTDLQNKKIDLQLLKRCSVNKLIENEYRKTAFQGI